jgi:hypothetical protein
MVTNDYATWAAWLTRFGRGEVDELEDLPPLRGEVLGPVAAQRLAARCGDALDARLGVWARSFDRDHGRAAHPDELRLAMVHARSRLAPLRRFAESDRLFPELREGLMDSLTKTITSLQEDLERQAGRSDLRVREAMIRVVRDVQLPRVLQGPALDAPSPEPVSPGTDGPRSRTILFAPTPQSRG